MPSRQQPASRHDAPAPGTRRAARHALLAAARTLIGEGGEPYTGKIVVTVDAPKIGERRQFTPVKGADGLPAAGQSDAAAAGEQALSRVPLAELARVLFSDDERRILVALADNPGAKAATVHDRCKVEKSRFWVLWSNLQFRGFVADADDGNGYTLGLPWVRGLLA